MPGGIIFQKALAEDLDVGIAEVDVAAPAGGSMRGSQVNLATFARRLTVAWSPGIVPQSYAIIQDFAVVGAVVGDPVIVAFSQALNGHLILHAHVAANSVVRVAFTNNDSTTAYNPGAGTLTILVFNIPVAA